MNNKKLGHSKNQCHKNNGCKNTYEFKFLYDETYLSSVIKGQSSKMSIADPLAFDICVMPMISIVPLSAPHT